MNSLCLEHAFMIWFRSANSHTGPQLHRCIRGRTDGSIRPRAELSQKPLASRGASTDVFRPSGRIGSSVLGRNGPVSVIKRLEDGIFRWPKIEDGVMRLSAALLSALLEGLD